MMKGYDSDDGMFLAVLRFDSGKLSEFDVECIWLVSWLQKDGNRYPGVVCHKNYMCSSYMSKLSNASISYG